MDQGERTGQAKAVWTKKRRTEAKDHWAESHHWKGKGEKRPGDQGKSFVSRLLMILLAMIFVIFFLACALILTAHQPAKERKAFIHRCIHAWSQRREREAIHWTASVLGSSTRAMAYFQVRFTLNRLWYISLNLTHLRESCVQCLPVPHSLSVFGIANEAEKGTVRERRKEERAIRMERENEREWHQSCWNTHIGNSQPTTTPFRHCISQLFLRAELILKWESRRERERERELRNELSVCS